MEDLLCQISFLETNKNKLDIYMFKISVYSNFILYI